MDRYVVVKTVILAVLGALIAWIAIDFVYEKVSGMALLLGAFGAFATCALGGLNLSLVLRLDYIFKSVVSFMLTVALVAITNTLSAEQMGSIAYVLIVFALTAGGHLTYQLFERDM